MSKELPSPKIGKIVSTINKWNPALSGHTDPFYYIDLSSVDQEEKRIVGAATIYPKEAPSRARQLVQEGDILVSTVRPNLNGVAYVPRELDGATASTGFCVLRPKQDNLDGRYLYHWVQYPRFIGEMVKLATGASYPAVSDRIVKDSKIPLPPLPEQKRIAAILDKADAIRRKRQQAIKLADDFLRATFLDMFGDPVTNPKGWEVKHLSKLCDVRDGTHDSPKYIQSGYPLVTSKNVKDGYLDFSDVNLISEEDYLQINKRSAVKKGDIIMPMIGTIGNPVLIETSEKFAIKNVALIKFKGAKINNNYVLHLLKSHYFEWIIQKSNRGGTQKFIALKDIRSFPIPAPDKTRQEKFADFCKKFKAHRMKANTINSIAGDLFNSLTQRAFRGEL